MRGSAHPLQSPNFLASLEEQGGDSAESWASYSEMGCESPSRLEVTFCLEFLCARLAPRQGPGGRRKWHRPWSMLWSWQPEVLRLAVAGQGGSSAWGGGRCGPLEPRALLVMGTVQGHLLQGASATPGLAFPSLCAPCPRQPDTHAARRQGRVAPLLATVPRRWLTDPVLRDPSESC